MSAPVSFALLDTFRGLFEGKRYEHRKSNLGNLVASRLYEDLVTLGRSNTLVERVHKHECVVNAKNVTTGKKARRGDGTFGELVPTAAALTEKGLLVARGPVANIQIGAETKIMAKAMNKQIGRVISDLGDQVTHFNKAGGNPITIAFVGINWASHYTAYERKRATPTDGTSGFRHPIQEAAEAEACLRAEVMDKFFEFQLLRFKATNVKPYPFEWLDYATTLDEYAAALVRISREYDKRFAKT